MGKYDKMSFGKAFAAARKEKGAGKTFTWKGKSYTTNYKEEEAKGSTTRPKKRPVTRSPRPKARPSQGGSTSSPRRAPTASARTAPTATSRRAPTASSVRASTQTSKKSTPRADKTDDARAAASRRGTSQINESQQRRRDTITFAEWKKLSRPERRRLGLPVSPIGMSAFLAKRDRKKPAGTSGRRNTR